MAKSWRVGRGIIPMAISGRWIALEKTRTTIWLWLCQFAMERSTMLKKIEVNHLFRLGPWLPWRSVNVITRLGIHGLWNTSGIYPDPQRSGVGICWNHARNGQKLSSWLKQIPLSFHWKFLVGLKKGEIQFLDDSNPQETFRVYHRYIVTTLW